ncbi:diguanylate cyclase [uncultured Sphingomonas sp.]|uniref:GGDEF domain-containing protein n=1 Tax=uncultured Sphingomonas sp. TaxID=158754 RepID=UPI0025D2BF04|nr:GGDEF domain-containing protein [uncultured Sphingomonas sp.]
MEAGGYGLAANVGVALLFALSFAAIAITDPGQRHARRFAAAYLIGMLTPICELLVRYTDLPGLFSIVGYAAFLASMVFTAHSVATFHGERSPRRLLIGLFVGGVAIRIMIHGGQRDWLPYELAYQMPFALALFAAAWAASRARPRRLLTTALAIDFALVALHFPIKAVASTWLGSGATARDYASSNYAVLSQAATGLLLTSVGLILLLLVHEASVLRSRSEANSDPLTGLDNRRGLFARLAPILADADRDGMPVQVVLFDLDTFKAINDRFGHAEGDRVIAGFGAILRAHLPQGAVAARMGGEEFAVMVPGITLDSGWRLAERIRHAAERAGGAGIAFTVSGGVATRAPGLAIEPVLARADAALYGAKAQGRNRVVRASTEPERAAAIMMLDRAS